MKNTLFISLLFLSVLSANVSAQIYNPKETAKRKTTDRANGAIDRTIDRGLDKIEEGIGNVFKKKEKTDKQTEGKELPDEQSQAQKQKEQASSGGWSSGNSSTTEAGGSKSRTMKADTSRKSDREDFEQFESFDFVAGEKTLFYDDFSANSLNTAPKGWEGNAEMQVIRNEELNANVLDIVHGGGFYPLALKNLPTDFTIEMVVAAVPGRANGTLDVRFLPSTEENPADPYFNYASTLSFSPNSQIPKKSGMALEMKDKDGNIMALPYDQRYFFNWHTDTHPIGKIYIAKKGEKVSVWINEYKLVDNLTFFHKGINYRLGLHFQDYFIEDIDFMLTNFRVATGFPTVKNDLAKGKFVTNNILFDTNSDKIKPESYPILKEIAAQLDADKSIRVKIIGHTDSDGSDASNLTLSQKRATSVKNALSGTFGINASRMETDGKGEGEPIAQNTTPQGKATNRRVEFIKL